MVFWLDAQFGYFSNSRDQIQRFVLVFGLQLSMARIGSTVNMNVMVPLYNKCMDFMTYGNRTLGMALLIAASTCVFSFICTAVIAAMDRNAEKQGAIGKSC